MLKLRTMWGSGHERGNPFWIERIEHREVPLHKGLPDPRVTSRFARFCRRYSVDELPQLWHVLSGRMSLAGPRPLTAIELEQHYGEAANEVLKLRPGITGLWQVLGRNRLTYHQRRRLDLFLARHRTPSLCLFILRRTLPVVLGGKDAA
jgi:lipopolysaccharide/colanic/teichoic acid biosynthesis glycosyltransferase